MKLKNINIKGLIFTVTLIVSTITFYGQEFAPIGAEWYYNEQFAFSGDINYIKFTSEKDTLIYGENCKKITKRHKIVCNNRPNTEFIFSRNDTVFFLDTAFNEFQILYDFNANPTDSWIIKIKDEDQEIDSITIRVDSISTIQINERNLKTLYVTYEKHDENMPEIYSSTIIEGIGDIKYMFNWYPWSNVVCDGNYTSGLRCYQDSNIGLYSTGIADSCDYVYIRTGIDNVESLIQIELFPNPTQDFVEIRIVDISSYSIELIDMNGKLLNSGKTFNSNLKLDISQIKKGVYVILIKENNQIIGYKKLIKG